MRLIAVLAHPADEAGEGAATLALYAAAGAEVMVVTCTGDEDTEQSPATEILGVGHHWLGFGGVGRSVPPDRFASVPEAVAVERLVRVLREFRPHVVITCAETASPLPDYVRCHDVAVAAFDLAGDPARYPATGRPWQPLKLYYLREWHTERIHALHDALLARELESPFHEWLKECVDEEEQVTTRVPCAEYLEVRDEAARAHPDGIDHWFAVPMRVRREVWPTEDFELVRCHVTTSLPESDLLAGISPR